ncbi:osmotically-inducible lipoprotein B [Chromobacterium sinusclupearum]|uniref:Osmotically-inducible lipoprotein B n=1 Tax=Chromobacterium sinusclupearum TaxID=2077146 RepID=A0A2K4MJ58_9NEIS|nr:MULTISPECIES: glycine zipper 2TM domain-containing protein [Chromobacterium]POA96765.1 osmotically-inducible lipoprotein B [Chromobacterium sinusclupearum]
MNKHATPTRLSLAASALIAISLLSGCANMTHRQQNTAIGATAGAVLGSVLTGGGTVGTLGGAAIGGVIGHQSR